MSQQLAIDESDYGFAPDSPGASRRVYLGIMQDLEERRMVPGQRLVETELAARFGVGRNAVREAMQRLAVRGVIDLSRHRSASIRSLDMAETLEVLDVAAALTGLVARAAANRFDRRAHSDLIAGAMAEFAKVGSTPEPGMFSRARRRFYRALLAIGGNRELQRLFPAIGMHIIYSQFQSPRLQDIRLMDYRAICDAVAARDADAAEREGRAHVEHVRAVILDLAAATGG